MRAAPADVLLGMRLGIGAAERAAVRRNVRVERGLPFRREHGKLVAEAAIAAVATAPAAAEPDGVRRPDAGDLLRVERHIGIVDLRVTRPRSRRAGRRLCRARCRLRPQRPPQTAVAVSACRSLRDRMPVLTAAAPVRRPAPDRERVSETTSAPSRSLILSTRPTTPPARDGAIVMLILVPGASACSERDFVHPTRSKPAGFGNSSPDQCATLPPSSITSKKICGCGFA